MEYKYVAGVDATQGGIGRVNQNASHKQRDADDFAISTLRFPAENLWPVELVNVARYNGITSSQMSAIIHRHNQVFNYELIVLDPSGGGIAVRDSLREPIQDTGGEKFQVKPLVTVDDTLMAGVGDPRLVLFSRADDRIRKLGLILTSESFLINKAHELLRGALEATPQRIRFPLQWEGWSMGHQFNNSDQMREWIDSRDLSGRDLVAAEIDLALFQLIAVARKTDQTGQKPQIDKYGMYEFVSSCKKDAAYSLCYAFFGAWMYMEELKISAYGTPSTPEFIIATQTI